MYFRHPIVEKAVLSSFTIILLISLSGCDWFQSSTNPDPISCDDCTEMTADTFFFKATSFSLQHHDCDFLFINDSSLGFAKVHFERDTLSGFGESYVACSEPSESSRTDCFLSKALYAYIPARYYRYTILTDSLDNQKCFSTSLFSTANQSQIHYSGVPYQKAALLGESYFCGKFSPRYAYIRIVMTQDFEIFHEILIETSQKLEEDFKLTKTTYTFLECENIGLNEPNKELQKTAPTTTTTSGLSPVGMPQILP